MTMTPAGGSLWRVEDPEGLTVFPPGNEESEADCIDPGTLVVVLYDLLPDVWGNVYVRVLSPGGTGDVDSAWFSSRGLRRLV
jgi:hypothetical protein